MCADFSVVGFWEGLESSLIGTVAVMYATPAGVLAYFDPLSGFIPYSMPASAALGAMTPALYMATTGAGFSPELPAMALAAGGAYAGPLFLTNMDYRTAGALGAFVTVFAGLYLMGGPTKMRSIRDKFRSLL